MELALCQSMDSVNTATTEEEWPAAALAETNRVMSPRSLAAPRYIPVHS
ncbi:hypothetical protein RR46_01575 [Papilio xuthus]|uniref:Uncharacterized protein n=1 Tax=Papilio xuthus TaxID=66420 RepID=A0A0N1PF23_PAPXU|nr:hypothetical protein RR46_01575 [Papilio xuthus]